MEEALTLFDEYAQAPSRNPIRLRLPGMSKKHLRIFLLLVIVVGFFLIGNVIISGFAPRSNPPSTTRIEDPANVIADIGATSLNEYSSLLVSNHQQGGLWYLDMNPNSSTPAVAITKHTIDISSANSRNLVIFSEFAFTGACCGGNSPNLYQYYLTTNATLPSFPNTYDPRTDPNVFLDMSLGNCAAGTCSYGLFEKINATITGSIAQEDYGNCVPSSSCIFFRNAPTVQIPNGGDIILNYTGQNGGSGASSNSGASCGNIGSGAAQTCGVTFDWSGGGSSILTGSASVRTFNYPRLDIGRKYFVGFFAKSTTAGAISMSFSVQNGANGQANDAMEIANFLPSATVSPPPAAVQPGGFFSPLINWFIQGGVWILKNIMQTLGWVFSGIVQVLNILGNFFGLGNLGSQLQNFFQGIVNWVTLIFAGAFGRIADLVNWVSGFLQAGINFFTSGFFTVFGQLITALAPLWSFVNTVYQSLLFWFANGTVGISYIFLLDWIYGMFEVYRKGTEGFHAWLDMNELVLTKIFRGMYWVVDESATFLLMIKQFIAQWM